MTIESVEWPRVHTGLGAATIALMSELEKTQWMRPQHIEAAQLHQARLLLQHHVGKNPWFATRMESAGLTPDMVIDQQSFRRIPILKRGDIQRAGNSFYATAVPKSHEPIMEIKTSGSTGEPVVVKKTNVNALFWGAHAVRDHHWSKRDHRSRISSIRADISSYAEMPSWGMPMSMITTTGPAQGMPASMDIAEQLRRVKQFKPSILLIYPNNLNAFLDEWEANWDMDYIKHIKTIGETVSPELRARTKAITGLKIEDNYSSNEMGCMAIQCPDHDHYHVMSETVILEILDDDGNPCKPGETGRVVVTDLHNFISPLIRYDIGDFAVPGEQCACGRGLPVLRRVVGREHSIIKRPDGTRGWPIFYGAKMNGIAPVRQYQFIQHTLNDIEFRCYTEEPLTPEQESGLIALVQEALGHPFNINLIQYRERLPTTKVGKFQEFICKA